MSIEKEIIKSIRGNRLSSKEAKRIISEVYSCIDKRLD